MDNKFPKSERLNSKKYIQELFTKGTGFTHFPFKVICLPLTYEQAREVSSINGGAKEPPRAQVLFSCSKRNFKKAVDRNTVKRRMREAYRLNKSLLPTGTYLLIAYIYIGREILSFHTIQEKLKSSFKRLGSIAQSEPLR